MFRNFIVDFICTQRLISQYKFLRLPKFYNRLLFLLLCFFCFYGTSISQIEYIQNKGQWDNRVTFMSNAGNGAVFLEKTGFTIAQYKSEDFERLALKMHGLPTNTNYKNADSNMLHAHAYSVEFLNANPKPEITPDRSIGSVNNYFIGNDKSKWASGCGVFSGVTYKNIYPGIDVHYYSDAGGRLKYDLIVAPGANIDNITLKYTGADNLTIKNNDLVISTSVGENKELSPYTYQVVGKERKELDCRYVLKGDILKFKVKNYNPTSTLIIDPTRVFFTYTGSTTDNWGFTATYGPDGSFFSGGIVFGTGFPVSTGAYKISFQGGAYDIGILKLTPDGVNRVYATYIGGSGRDQPHSLIVDAQGNLVLTGITDSGDYPTTGPVYGSGGGWDIFVTKLNASGTALIGSLRIGGSGDDGVNIVYKGDREGTDSLNRNYGDDARSQVILDGGNNIYIAACTRSVVFPTSPGVVQPTVAGRQDAVVLKINPNCNAVVWSTCLGGTADDAAYVITLGLNNNVYIAGGTGSNAASFREISPTGVISSNNSGGDCDGFVVELNNTATAVIKGTFLGTPAADQVYGIQSDKVGNIYVMGQTEGTWPILNAQYFNPNGKQFIAKLQPDLSAYIYSTVFGSGSPYPNISPTAFLVDRCENVYVSGWGGKANSGSGYHTGTTIGLPVTPDAIKPVTDPSGSDFYFIVIKRDAASLLYGTFFGQDDPVGANPPRTFGDHVDGGTSRFDRNGVIYQAICANCGRQVNFQGDPGSWRPQNLAQTGGMCNLGMLKIAMNFAGVAAGPQASINGIPNDTLGCVSLTVTLADTIQATSPQKGKKFVWDFGDGTPKDSSGPLVTHTYGNIGRYLVTLVAIDSTTCNISDTAYLTIKAGDNKATLDFDFTKLPPCTNLTDSFFNKSYATFTGFGPKSFTWDFGDGSPKVNTGLNFVRHTYSGPGTYVVHLSLDDTLFCNSPLDTFKTVRLSPVLKAKFNTPAKGCAPYNAVFENVSLGGLNFLWDFGDGTTSTLDNPTHLYPNVGTYTVKLYGFDSTACNTIDSTSFTISVNPIPIASFTFSPVPPLENKPIDFTNRSFGADSYLWKFGDGDSSTEVNPSYTFNATGKYSVCLTAFSSAGCADDTCMSVDALIRPLLDVPNAFTPGKFGINGTISVKGFGIKEMKWSIYNRWGQKVFETTSTKSGWDGTYKGVLQPMDVYSYTLDASFTDGKSLRKTGDITLLR